MDEISNFNYYICMLFIPYLQYIISNEYQLSEPGQKKLTLLDLLEPKNVSKHKVEGL